MKLLISGFYFWPDCTMKLLISGFYFWPDCTMKLLISGFYFWPDCTMKLLIADVDCFYVALFSALKQTQCALVACDSKRVTVAFYIVL